MGAGGGGGGVIRADVGLRGRPAILMRRLDMAAVVWRAAGDNTTSNVGQAG